MTEDELVGWHHHLNGLELEQALGDGEVNREMIKLRSKILMEFFDLIHAAGL